MPRDEGYTGAPGQEPANPDRRATADAADGAGLGRKAARGALWFTMQRWVGRLSGLITATILARLITPSEFGIVAAAMTVLPLVNLLSDLGFTTYLVQADDLDDETLSTGFWFSLGASVVLGLGLVVAAPPIAMLFGQPQAVPILRSLSILVVLVVLGTVPYALLRRRLAFRTAALIDSSTAIVAQVVAIALAFSGAGAWALVVQQITSQALSVVLLWLIVRWRPRWQFSFTTFRAMTHFGSRVVTTEVVATARLWGETAIISHALGAAALGYMSIAQRLVTAAQDLTSTAIVPVSLPVFSQVRTSLDRLRSAYARSLGLVYVLAAPILIFISVGASRIIPTLFGSGWLGAVPMTQGLAVAAILVIGANIDNGLLYATGRPGTWLSYSVAVDTLTVATTAVAVRFGLSGVAWAFVGVALVATVARWFLTAHVLQTSVRTTAQPFLTATICAGMSGLAGWAVLEATPSLPAIANLAVCGAAIIVVQGLSVRLVSPRTCESVIDLAPIPDRARRLAKRLTRLPVAPRATGDAIAVEAAGGRPEVRA